MDVWSYKEGQKKGNESEQPRNNKESVGRTCKPVTVVWTCNKKIRSSQVNIDSDRCAVKEKERKTRKEVD